MMRFSLILVAVLISACGRSGHSPDHAVPPSPVAPRARVQRAKLEDVRRQLNEIDAGIAEYMRANEAI